MSSATAIQAELSKLQREIQHLEKVVAVELRTARNAVSAVSGYERLSDECLDAIGGTATRKDKDLISHISIVSKSLSRAQDFLSQAESERRSLVLKRERQIQQLRKQLQQDSNRRK